MRKMYLQYIGKNINMINYNNYTEKFNYNEGKCIYSFQHTIMIIDH